MTDLTLAHLMAPYANERTTGGTSTSGAPPMHLVPSAKKGTTPPKKPAVHHEQHTVPAHFIPPPPPTDSGYGPLDIDLSLSDRVCVELQASACTVLEDVCGLVEGSRTSKAAGPYCEGLRSYCTREADAHSTPAVTVEAKMCVNFEANIDACQIVAEACKKGSAGEKSTFCTKAVSLCTAQI